MNWHFLSNPQPGLLCIVKVYENLKHPSKTFHQNSANTQKSTQDCFILQLVSNLNEKQKQKQKIINIKTQICSHTKFSWQENLKGTVYTKKLLWAYNSHTVHVKIPHASGIIKYSSKKWIKSYVVRMKIKCKRRWDITLFHQAKCCKLQVTIQLLLCSNKQAFCWFPNCKSTIPHQDSHLVAWSKFLSPFKNHLESYWKYYLIN